MMQMISTLTNKPLERPCNIETSSLGCCFLAGLGIGKCIFIFNTVIGKLKLIKMGRAYCIEAFKF